MKASKFTKAQKGFILKQGWEGTPVAEICRKAGIGQLPTVEHGFRHAHLAADLGQRPCAPLPASERTRSVRR